MDWSDIMSDYLDSPVVCLSCIFCSKYIEFKSKECLVYCYYPYCYFEKCVPCNGFRGSNDETK